MWTRFRDGALEVRAAMPDVQLVVAGTTRAEYPDPREIPIAYGDPGLVFAAADALGAWRARHADVACTLVRGNHDRHAGDPPAHLHFNVVEEPWRQGPFALCHQPQTATDGYEIAGHVHPGVVLSGRGKDRVRLPCFRFGQTRALLPAFGEFTGLWTAPASPGERLYGVADDRVWPL